MALEGQGFSLRGQFSSPDIPPGQSVSYSKGLLYNSSLRFVLHQARAGRDPASLKPAIELAGRLIAAARQGHRLLVALEGLLLRAQMHALGGRQSNLAASLADYDAALELGEEEGFIGVFVDQGLAVAKALADLVERNRLGALQPGYVERILDAFSGSRSPGATSNRQLALHLEAGSGALIEPLTEREQEVLRLMAEGLKYKEIAARLFISVNTVRFHVKAIYGKLIVNNRIQAIQAARQLRML
jgi:LuxR family maltose regulon positive regulatory protein